MEKLSPLQPKKTESLTSLVCARIRQAIVNIEFGFGEHLSEDKLAAAFGISRTPVRDALTMLQAQGLIEIKPHHGSFVFMPSRQEVSDLYEFRTILEIQALKMSIPLRKNRILPLLIAANDRMVAARKMEDLLAIAQADVAFHRSIIDNCGNQCLVESYELISGRMDSIRTRISVALKDIRTRAINEHSAIIAALEKDNLSRARTILSSHVSTSLAWFDMACKEGLLSAPHRSELPYSKLSLDSAKPGQTA